MDKERELPLVNKAYGLLALIKSYEAKYVPDDDDDEKISMLMLMENVASDVAEGVADNTNF